MNAAFVLLTSALLGHHPAAASCSTCAPAPAPVVVSCDTCAGPSFGHKLRDRLSGLFSCPSCKTEEPCPAPCPAPAPACEATPACHSHGHAFGGGDFFARLRGKFRHRSACDSCEAAPCDGGCSSAPATAAPPVADPAAPAAPGTPPAEGNTGGAPKKMPEAPKNLPKQEAPKGDKAVRINQTNEPAPLSIPTVSPVINNRPAIIVAPATLRNPF